MRYLLLVYESTPEWLALSDRERREISDACSRWHESLLASGHARMATGLHGPATASTVRFRAGAPSVTDGPFAETKEVLGGFEMVECRDHAEAVEIAKTFPALSAGFAVEVRRELTNEEEQVRWREAGLPAQVE